MIRATLLVLCIAALAMPAAAQPRPQLMFIHHPDDGTMRLQVGTFIDAWTEDDNIAVGALDPGSHVVHVTLPDGRKLSRAYLFWTTKLSERDGQRYWCVVLRAKAASASDESIELLEPEDCVRQLEQLKGH